MCWIAEAHTQTRKLVNFEVSDLEIARAKPKMEGVPKKNIVLSVDGREHCSFQYIFIFNTLYLYGTTVVEIYSN